jgi:Fic family protein
MPAIDNKAPGRAGHYARQIQGYKAFIPADLPPVPPIRMDDELQMLLSEADRALGRLDGATETLPNPELFVFMYVRKEAVLSSQIEGTQASLMDILEFEAKAQKGGHPEDVSEVVNYVAAMKQGLQRLETLPVSLRLIREIHGTLLKGVRGGDRRPGEFRTRQNWIGAEGSPIERASFVPPPPKAMLDALDSLERFLHDESPMPPLSKVGLAHAQFETIHPFIDGNGRVGRLLITFLLCEKKVLRRPLLYLSHYLKARRTEYYDRLQAVRDRGDWEGWLRFFFRGIASVSIEATQTARKIVDLRERHRKLLASKMGRGAGSALALMETLYFRPIVSVKQVAEITRISFPNANALVEALEKHRLLVETTGRRRNRVFAYQPYLALLEKGDAG